MEFVSKKGDVLFVGEGDESFAVTILNTVKFEDENYLHVIAVPLGSENIIGEDMESEFVREVVDGENFDLEPVEDKRILDALNQEVENMREQKEV